MLRLDAPSSASARQTGRKITGGEREGESPVVLSSLHVCDLKASVVALSLSLSLSFCFYVSLFISIPPTFSHRTLQQQPRYARHPRELHTYRSNSFLAVAVTPVAGVVCYSAAAAAAAEWTIANKDT